MLRNQSIGAGDRRRAEDNTEHEECVEEDHTQRAGSGCCTGDAWALGSVPQSGRGGYLVLFCLRNWICCTDEILPQLRGEDGFGGNR